MCKIVEAGVVPATRMALETARVIWNYHSLDFSKIHDANGWSF